jgi:hypothetical protein
MDNSKSTPFQINQQTSKTEYMFQISDRKYNTVKMTPLIIPKLDRVRSREQDITSSDRFYKNSQTGYKAPKKIEFFNFSEMDEYEYTDLRK